MQNQSQIEALLLKWLKHRGKCAIEQIRNACLNLLKSFHEEPKHPLYKVLFPLVRKGYVEFCGNGYYQPTQPSILFYNKNQTGVGINLSDEQNAELEEFIKVDEDEFGIVRFVASKNEVCNFLEKNNCEYSEPNAPEILNNFPKISDVIQKFEKATITSTSIQFYDLELGWAKNKNQSIGVFRLSEDSLKFYIRTNQSDFQIPDSKINPDGRPLAESYQAIISELDFLIYEKNKKRLTIKTVNIPILIDRILRMASLNKHDGIEEDFRQITYSNISYSTVKQLNRIFGTQIKIE